MEQRTFPARFHTVPGAFEWAGLSVEFGPGGVTVLPGRIGRSANPLRRSGRRVDGGWFHPGGFVALGPEDRSLDILLDTATGETVTLVRGGDFGEQYDGDRYDLLLPLLRREGADAPWLVATPLGGGHG